jgi:hypothetical protein
MQVLRGRRSSRRRGGIEPLTPRRRWMTITVATAVLAPAYWTMLVGLIGFASDDSDLSATAAAGALAFGLSVVPFVFIVLAFMSSHPSAPGAVIKAMLLFLAVGISVSALATDAVSGLVAGVGAGGIAALRADLAHEWKHRAVAVAIATVYAFVLARVLPPAVIVTGPVFPLTAIGMADQWSERRRSRG